MADFAMAMKKKLADINVHSFNDFKMKVGKWNTLSSINSFNSLLAVSEVRAVLANAVILVANCIFYHMRWAVLFVAKTEGNFC